jgi:TDG/mug DNA glycosylase family protein
MSKNHARGSTKPSLPDIVRPEMKVLFVGINPALESVRVGHYHQGRLGRRFWRVLVEGGLLPEPAPGRFHDEYLLKSGLGITDLVKRPTRSAREVTRAELEAGRKRVLRIIGRCRPRVVCGVYKRALEVLLGRRLTGEWGLLEGERIAGARVLALRWAYVEWEVALASVRELRRVAEV